MKLAERTSGLIVYISMDRPDLQFSSKTEMSTIAKPLQITKSRLRKIARYLEDKPVLALAYQNEVDECMAFGDSDRARDRETRRSTTAVPEKLGNNCIGCVSRSRTVIALSSGEAEFYALQRAAACALQTQHISIGGDGLCERLCEVITLQQSGFRREPMQANCGISESKKLWIQELLQARKLVIKKVGTDENPADFGTEVH